jgi:hypothetical protein
MRITLDTNCLVDLERSEGSYINLQKLISLYNSRVIELCVPGIGASERLRGKMFADNFSIFQERIKRISKKRIRNIKTALLRKYYIYRLVYISR